MVENDGKCDCILAMHFLGLWTKGTPREHGSPKSSKTGHFKERDTNDFGVIAPYSEERSTCLTSRNHSLLSLGFPSYSLTSICWNFLSLQGKMAPDALAAAVR